MVDSSRTFMIRIAPPILLAILSMVSLASFGGSQVLLYNSFFFSRVFCVCVTFLFDSCFFFLLFLEISSIPMFFLILNYSKGRDKISAAIFILFINFLGSMPFFYFRVVKDELFQLRGLDSVYSFFILFCFFLILGSKVPVFFLHFWLTKAHVRASGSCSMLLARLMLKLGTFGLFKFSCTFFRLFKSLAGPLFRVGVFGSLVVGLVMIRFFDVKLLIACSSIAHMVMITPFCFAPLCYPICGSLIIIVGHGLVSYFLFYVVTLIYEASFNRSYDFIKSLESVRGSLPLLLCVYLFLNLGLPPFLNFLSELNFCVGLYVWSKIRMLLFSLSIVSRIIFLIFFVTKGSFGKNTLLVSKGESAVPIANFFFYFALLIVCPAFYLYSFSLIPKRYFVGVEFLG